MHKAFFGDRERVFSLTPHLIPELEKITGKEITAIVEGTSRMGFADMVHTVRLGLIGAGEHPKEAAELVQTYVNAHPLYELHLLAVEILNLVWNGPEAQPDNDAAATGDLSAAINAGAA
jgi:hypothetical protein